ncbi:MAG: hypothetical protein QG652_87 [Pseudomonadota bacterium]|nr:hypothetical protein [Pseudomonadota bacterium]
MKEILIPISPGELLDKITILRIKSQRMSDASKQANVQKELRLLDEVWLKAVAIDSTVTQLTNELTGINEALWDIEDDIREEERNKRFGERFIELARSVYITNDKRAEIKKKINLHLGSVIVEEKSYQNYT